MIIIIIIIVITNVDYLTKNFDNFCFVFIMVLLLSSLSLFWCLKENMNVKLFGVRLEYIM